jgi:serine/threonine protein kinase
VAVVFDRKDPAFTSFRSPVRNANSDSSLGNGNKNWLWQSWGRILILEIPFYEGRHFAKTASELLSVVDRLIELHSEGYVHGDIRPFNIVFNGMESRLIDLDLGGKLSERPIYPVGYVRTVDGVQRLGRAGETITKSDDWYALLSVIFKLHVFSPAGTGSSLPWSATPFRHDARCWLHEQNDITSHQITELRQFLNQRDLKVQPELDFVDLLKANGQYPLRTNCARSDAGTGTRPKNRDKGGDL